MPDDSIAAPADLGPASFLLTPFVGVPVWIWGLGVIFAWNLLNAPSSEYYEKSAKLREQYTARGRAKARARKIKKGFGVAFS